MNIVFFAPTVWPMRAGGRRIVKRRRITRGTKYPSGKWNAPESRGRGQWESLAVPLPVKVLATLFGPLDAVGTPNRYRRQMNEG